MKRFLSISLSILLLIGMLQASSLGHAAQGSVLIHPAGIAAGLITSPLPSIGNPFGPPDWTGTGGLLAGAYGASVASAGDVNGDGYSDVVVGAPLYENGQIREGRAYLYYGSATGLASTPTWTYESNIVGCELGWSAASAGDINNDGFDDVLVGAHYCTTSVEPGHREGRAYLFMGGATGLSATYAWMVEGEGVDESLGWEVASAGDVNNDGFADVIITAPWASYPEGHEGRVYVFYGSGTGLAATADWTVESDQEWSDFGYSADTAGDVNGDGFDDVIVGWPGLIDGEQDEGGAFIYLGSNTGLSVTADWSFQSNHAFTELGESVSGAGDVNGDGFSDVVVGGYKYTNPAPVDPDGILFQGIAYLFLGSATGPSLVPDWSHAATQDNAGYGQSVASAGDVNRDGYDDVLVGAPGYSDGEQYEGVAFLYFGSASGLLPAPVYTVGSNIEASDFGISVASAGDVNGDSFADMIIGASQGAGKASAFYGITARMLLPVVLR